MNLADIFVLKGHCKFRVGVRGKLLARHAFMHVRTRARPFFHGQMKKTGNEMCSELVVLSAEMTSNLLKD